MKRTVLVLLLTAIVSGASARIPAGHFRDGFDRGLGHRSGFVVRGGYYNSRYAPFGLYYSYPYYGYSNLPVPPTQLDLQITQIKNDYAGKIGSVKLDNSLSGKERREKVRELKRDRTLAVMQAKKYYYRS